MSLFPAYGKNSKSSASTQPGNSEKTPKVREVKNLPWLQVLKVTETLLSTQSDNNAISQGAQSNGEERRTSKSPMTDAVNEKRTNDHKSGCDTDSKHGQRSKESRLHEQHHSKKKHSKKKKKDSHRSRDQSPEPQTSHHVKDGDCYEDRKPVRSYLKAEKLYRPVVPGYERKCRKVLGQTLCRASVKTRKKSNRYYSYSLDDEESSEAERVRETLVQIQENDITVATEQFNVRLEDKPQNIDLWIEYVNYQEVIHQFERTYRGARGRGTMAERQLSIIDRALSLNPDNRQLVRKRVAISESALAPEAFAQQIEALLSKQPTSIELWRGFVQATQGSMALCTVSGVLNLYMKATQKLHQTRRGAPASYTLPAENGIIDLLLDCGIFLRQSGLWEHVWMLVQAYLTLNLITPTTKYFELKIEVPEDDVMAEEMKVMRSGLPLMTLWSRVERIREDAHWLPVSENEQCADHHRRVTREEVAVLVHPITEPFLNFRLISVCMLLLKIPVLPCRDCWLRFLGVDQVPWAVDGPEWFLPILQTPSPLWKSAPPEMVLSVLPLAEGPQYLNATLGQPLYLQAVSKMLLLVSEVVLQPAATAYVIWWVRFQRLMISLEQSGICKLPSSHRKIRSKVKEILKQEQYRNNLSLYHEYALLEMDSGRMASAQLVLLSAADAAFPGVPIAGIADTTARAALIGLYRSLCEMKLSQGDKEGALKVLLMMVTDRSGNEDISTEEAESKFAHIGAELLNDAPCGDADGTESLLPDAAVNWFICHALLVFLTDSPWESQAIFEEAFEKCEAPGDSVTKQMCRLEAFWEGYICVLQWLCFNSKAKISILEDTLIQALKLFPNNLHFLTSFLGLQNFTSSVSPNWCRLSNHFTNSEQVLPQVFLILNGFHRQIKVKEANIEAHKFLKKCGPVLISPCEQNKCSALLDRLLSSYPTKYCPLLWRLKLKMQPSEQTFYRAVDECPWVRGLYVNGILSVPGKADKLQTLLMEKELRCHVLPDELEVIRSGFEALAAIKQVKEDH